MRISHKCTHLVLASMHATAPCPNCHNDIPVFCDAKGVPDAITQHPGGMLKEMMDTCQQACQLLEQMGRTSAVPCTQIPSLRQETSRQELLASPASGGCGGAIYTHSNGVSPVPQRVPPRRQLAAASGLPGANTHEGRLALLQCKAKSASLGLPSTVKKSVLKR